MARINILHSSHEGRVRLNLNGREHIVTVPQGGKGEATVPDEYLPLLTDSNIDYEIIVPGDGRDEAEAGAGGDSGAVSAEPKTDEPAAAPTPGVDSPTFDASSNAAMPASPPNVSPSTPKPKAAKPKTARKPRPKKAAKPAA